MLDDYCSPDKQKSIADSLNSGDKETAANLLKACTKSIIEDNPHLKHAQQIARDVATGGPGSELFSRAMIFKYREAEADIRANMSELANNVQSKLHADAICKPTTGTAQQIPDVTLTCKDK